MIDWDDAFDNSGYVDGADQLPDRWAQQAAALRADVLARDMGGVDVSYGADPRMTFDSFLPAGDHIGTLVFVHGGYWLRFDKSYWSHLAAGPMAHGWGVVMPSYPLAPGARMSEITDAIRAVILRVAEKSSKPLILAGHSAGGHLVTRMACAGMLPDEVTARIKRVISISGVHHLTPLLQTKMNDTLRLTQEEALAESPVELDPTPRIKTTFWVGADERPEFLRQTRMIAERWSAKGADVTTHYEPGKNHFNVIGSLVDPKEALTLEVVRP